MAQLKRAEEYRERPVYYKKPEIRKLPSYIPLEVLKKSQQGYDANHFTVYLHSLFGTNITHELIQRYQIGTSGSRWPGATVFWWIDVAGKIRAGQVKQFDHTGHTVKSVHNHSHTTWIHSILKHNHESKGEHLPSWLSTYLDQGGNYASCLFGEHLLKEDTGKPIAIVEAPATAIVAGVYLPGFVWLAAGSLSYLTAARTQVLSGRQVYLFPDLSADGRAFELWCNKARELASIATFTVSDLLERSASTEERLKGLDLRDFLTRFDYQLFQPAPPEGNKHTLIIDGQEYEINAIATVSEIEGYKIVSYLLRNAKVCDVLYNAAGELADIQEDFSQVICTCIGKVFKRGKLNGVDCFLLLLKNS
ncbi:DUF6371 domain-containing protein [Chitinophaga sp. HK235]|uniref:DUF6371 domain-containing protein n=1 Tax=Chitinophaga sp. HK235 TaxID=2952571 RepID=UPI001BA9D765|nr:DUF6371 domain-containing protein [Chitinophaga sp. HK235]